MKRLKASFFSILLASMNVESNSALAQSSRSWVDLLSKEKICAAKWSWVETIESTYEIVEKNCEKRTVTVLDMDAPPIRTIASGISEVPLGSGTANVETKDLQEARRRAIELVVAEYVKQGFDKNIYNDPTITNPAFLSSSYPYYSQLVGNQKVPDDAIMTLKGVAKESWSCSAGGPVGVTGRPLEPSDCGKIEVEVDVYGLHHPVTYTLPTKQVQEQVDSFCSETEYKYIPAQAAFGLSDAFLPLAEVSEDSYLSINGSSLKGATKSKYECPHGVQLSDVRSQAYYALAWLNRQKKPYDTNEESLTATIRYLKAIALEKGELLTPDQVDSILQLQDEFPEIAFGGQETLDNALETSPEEATTNREKWVKLKNKVSGATGSAPSRLEGAESQLKSRLGSELNFKANTSMEYYHVASFSLSLSTEYALSLKISSRSGYMNVEFFTNREIKVERNNSGEKVYLSPSSLEYNIFVDELINVSSNGYKAALAAGPTEVVPYFSELLEYLNALRSESN